MLPCQAWIVCSTPYAESIILQKHSTSALVAHSHTACRLLLACGGELVEKHGQLLSWLVSAMQLVHELQCTYVHIKSWGLTTAYLGDMAIFYRNLSSSNELRQTRDQKAVHSTESINQSFKFEAGSACGQRVTGVQGRLRGREGSSKGHVLMP